MGSLQRVGVASVKRKSHREKNLVKFKGNVLNITANVFLDAFSVFSAVTFKIIYEKPIRNAYKTFKLVKLDSSFE